ncbi:MAG: response regulator transcription factor [Desulfobacterium sp.]|nr:response regulator transcription factor [Desulfobacterium sp.]
MTPNIRLLIIEDNPAIVENMTEFLESKGYILDFAMDGIGGLHLALTRDYDVIVLDLMLPGMDGIALCRKLRREADKHVPVIMVTARDTLDDKLLGFESGADDYLVKPFALKELEARIKALAKRRVSTNKVLAVDDLRMNLGTYEVTRGDKKIDKPFEHFITCKRGDESRLWPGAEHSFPAVQTLWLETDH